MFKNTKLLVLAGLLGAVAFGLSACCKKKDTAAACKKAQVKKIVQAKKSNPISKNRNEPSYNEENNYYRK